MNRMCQQLIIPAVLLFLAACGGEYRNHGYMPSTDDVNELVVGVDTREGTMEVLGAPSTSGMMTDKALYYVRSRIHHRGYKKPNEINREVLVLSYDQNDILRNIERFDINRGNVVFLVHRITDAPGGDRNILQQLIGSIGGINPNAILGEE